MDEFIGVIKLFAGTFVPQGWLACNGQVLPINNYQALYSLLGTTYGGNGTTTFALPDLRGRVPMGTGQGNGLSPCVLGQTKGVETVSLGGNNIPALTANVQVNNLTGSASGTVAGNASAEIKIPCANAQESGTPVGNVMGANGELIFATNGTNFMKPFNANVPISLNANLPVSVSGSGTASINAGVSPNPVNNLQPSLGLNYIICVNGIYPMRP